MIKLKTVLLLGLLSFVVGCSSQVTRPDNADVTRPAIKALHDFTVELSPNAELQLTDNVKFDIDTLRSVLDRTLNGKNLVSADGDYSLKVVVNDIRVRSTFNAVMWGFMAGNDHLRGEATVLNLDGETVYSFEASASYALGGFGGGQDSSRMNWLYEEFSEMVANELMIKKNE